MATIKYSSVFHSVGHGLFHSGEFSLKNTYFNYVIDCGKLGFSQEIIQREVNSYLQYTKRKSSSLNLLIISHLDQDHVSGLPMLIDGFDHIDLVVLPYLTPIERLLLYFRSTNPSDWYGEFITNPSDYLSKFDNIDEIVYVSGEPDGDSDPEPILSKESFKIIGKERKSSVFEAYMSGEDPCLIRRNSTSVSLLSSVKAALRIGFEFVFFTYHVADDKLANFVKDANDLLEGTTIEAVLKNRKLRKTLHDLYVATGDINNTSLCVSISNIGPLVACRLGCVMVPHYTEVNHYIAAKDYSTRRHEFGLIFTGDINLKEEEIYHEFKEKYTDVAKKILVYSIPHHGSIKNWNNLSLNLFLNAVMAYSSKEHSSRHPDPAIIRQITERSRRYLYSTENIELRVSASIETIK